MMITIDPFVRFCSLYYLCRKKLEIGTDQFDCTQKLNTFLQFHLPLEDFTHQFLEIWKSLDYL
ncbi:MAG: hypothetical protein CVU40_11865 [Chloroflexi bacterium HGW-Chloroflexi-2]|nr:MAG: hypothetical protein CVU40_11865 [Chloroflexi bacterium HGW-Chloroflexi-2]